jgi:hypothetical protein
MRFMMIVKSAENSGPPPKALMDAMAKSAEEATKAGEMIDSGGLASTARGRARPAFWGKDYRDRWTLHRG